MIATSSPTTAGTEEARRRRGLGLALVTACLSGVAVFVNGYGVRRFPDATLYTTAKNLVAGVALTIVACALARRPTAEARPRPPAPRRAWVGLAFVATIGGSVPFVLFFEGLARASSTEAAVIHKTLVVWVALLAVPLLHERLSGWHLGAIGLLVGGQVVLAGGLPFVSGTGEAMILAATLLWAAETVLAKHLLRSLSPTVIGLARMGLGSAALVTWTAATGKLSLLDDVSGTGWLIATATGLVLAGYVACWFAALSRAPAVDVTALLVVGAVVTALLNAAVEGAPLAPDASGLGLILAGGALVMLPRPRPAPARAGA